MKKLMLVCLALLCLFAGCRKDSKKTGGRSDWKPPETEAEEEWTGPTVTVAFSTKLSGSIPTKIKNFEKNEAVKVIQLDYSQYNTSLEPRGGEDKLALDLTTGLIKPDIIISPEPSSKEAIVIEEKHLYRDLTSYLEADDLLNPGNIFGSVLELYTADDGTIWGLPDEIGAEMLIGNDAVLGEYAGRDGWTLDEMLDFAESLPADVTLIPVLFQQTAPSILLGPVGYSIFVDRKSGTCSFDSPSFLRWLKFLKALPATYDELKAKSPYDATPQTEKYEYAYNNKLALEERTYTIFHQFVESPSLFGTNAYTSIGFPDSGDVSFCPMVYWTYMLGASGENPDDAWRLYRSFFEPERSSDGHLLGTNTVSILKDVYDERAKEQTQQIYITYFSGKASGVKKNPDNPFTEDDLTEPGFLYEFTEEDAARLKEMFDTRKVRRIVDRAHSEVNAIVTEEISSFLAGHSTAETCASAIQSRVTLWLEEHK